MIDLKEPPVEVDGYHRLNLCDPEATPPPSTRSGAHRLPVQLRRTPRRTVLGPRHHAGQLRGQRHLADLVVERMGRGRRHRQHLLGAGTSWQGNVEKWMPLVATEGFAAGRQWLEDHPS